MSEIPKRTRVVIIGGGPAGSLLAHLLHLRRIDSVILELRTREHVLERVRAGVIEHGSAEVLRETGAGKRMDAEGFVHEGVNLAHAGKMLRIDFQGLTGKHVTIYGQTELQKDLYDLIDTDGIPLIDEAEEVMVEGIEGDSPDVGFERRGVAHVIACDFVIGCDGAHGVSRDFIPAGARSRMSGSTRSAGWGSSPRPRR